MAQGVRTRKHSESTWGGQEWCQVISQTARDGCRFTIAYLECIELIVRVSEHGERDGLTGPPGEVVVLAVQ